MTRSPQLRDVGSVTPPARRLAQRYWPGALTLVLPLLRPELVPEAECRMTRATRKCWEFRTWGFVEPEGPRTVIIGPDENVMVCCGRMGPMCIPVYGIMEELEEDGFVVLTQKGRLSITGGSEKGTLYGVYYFLEEYLGCRKYSSKVSVVPAQFNISVNSINDKEIPVFKFREVLYRDVYQPEYMAWHGLDNHGSYNLEGDWGNWTLFVNAE